MRGAWLGADTWPVGRRREGLGRWDDWAGWPGSPLEFQEQVWLAWCGRSGPRALDSKHERSQDPWVAFLESIDELPTCL